MLYDEAKQCDICPKPTGIPPHITLLNDIQTIKDKLDYTVTELTNVFRNELNIRHVGNETFRANEVLDDVKRLHEKMENLIKSQENNQTQLGMRNFNGRDSRIGSIINMHEDDGAHQGQGATPAVRINMICNDGEGNRRRRQMYCWGGQLHNVPENFKIPTMTLQTLITYWYCGSIQPQVPPLRYMKAFDFPQQIKTMKVVISQMKRTMKAVERAARLERFNMNGGIHSTAKATQLYEAIYKYFWYPSLTRPNKRRFSSITWKTFHNLLVKNKGKLVGEE